MIRVIVLLSMFALSRAASIVPVDSSVVNVKSEHSGQDYSYTIQENRGYTFNPVDIGVHPVVPVIRTVPEVPGGFHPIEQAPTGVQQQPRPQSVAKAVVPGQGFPVGSHPVTYLNYVPVSYQYGSPYGYTHPYNFYGYRIAA